MSPNTDHDWLTHLEAKGFALLPGVFQCLEVEEVLKGLSAALNSASASHLAMRNPDGEVCGARNVQSFWPSVAGLWRRPPLADALRTVLGPEFGLVRVLYFDKPPGQSWTLPWHKDLTIALREAKPSSTLFRKPTRKAGIPHAEAPQTVLEGMLTARLHLDEMTEENGPLKVIPGSHTTGKELLLGDATPVSIHANCGDVLLMRPLLAHCSGRADANTQRHRRILHFEFAASPQLPEGCEWHTFLPNRAVPVESAG